MKVEFTKLELEVLEEDVGSTFRCLSENESWITIKVYEDIKNKIRVALESQDD